MQSPSLVRSPSGVGSEGVVGRGTSGGLMQVCRRIAIPPIAPSSSGRSQGMNRPRPGLPAGLPSRHTASPREKVAIGHPSPVMPS